MTYTAKEVAKKLRDEGYLDVTSRMVNYYAFEKKMFDVSLTGKKCFTEKEIEKIKGIKRLQKTTNFTLEQIKEIINKYNFKDIMVRISPIVYQNVEDFYQSPGYIQSLASSSAKTDNYLQCSRNSCLNADNQLTQNIITNTITDMKEINIGQRTIKVNQDVNLTVSNQVNTDTLIEIVKCIQQITKKSNNK